MSDVGSSFERLMALFRYRGLDPSALMPGQSKTLEALMEAGRRVAVDLENLARRQSELIETSTRELMGNAPALAQPDRFKEATNNNLKTLTNAADATMHHLGQLAELLIEYNGEVISAMNRTVLDSMNGVGGMTHSMDAPEPPPAAAARKPARAAATRAAPARGAKPPAAAKPKSRKAKRRRKA